MTRRALIPLLVLAAGLLAACVPVTPPPPPPPPPPPQPVSQYCAPSTPNSAGAYQAAFDNLRKTYTEWATADGAVPVHLPDGRTLWLFSDTFIGKVTSSGVITPNDKLVANSAVVQTGRCFRPLMGGAPLARNAWIADPGPSQAYWPVSAVVDPAQNQLHVFLAHIQRPQHVLQTRIATFSLPGLSLLGISTLAQTSADKPFGQTVVVDGDTAYIYASNDGDVFVARTPIASLKSTSQWEYWNGSDWSVPGAFGSAQPMQFSGIPPIGTLKLPIAPLEVVPHGAGYLGTAMLIDAFSNTAGAFTAPTPAGPWTYEGSLATTPSGVFSYLAKTMFGLQGGAPPIVGYSTNVSGFPTTISQYGPRFVPPVNLPAPLTTAAVPEVPEPTAPSTTPSTLPPSTLPPSSTTTSTSSTTTSSAPPP